MSYASRKHRFGGRTAAALAALIYGQNVTGESYYSGIDIYADRMRAANCSSASAGLSTLGYPDGTASISYDLIRENDYVQGQFKPGVYVARWTANGNTVTLQSSNAYQTITANSTTGRVTLTLPAMPSDAVNPASGDGLITAVQLVWLTAIVGTGAATPDLVVCHSDDELRLFASTTPGSARTANILTAQFVSRMQNSSGGPVRLMQFGQVENAWIEDVTDIPVNGQIGKNCAYYGINFAYPFVGGTYNTTSTTSLATGTGSKVFTVPAGLSGFSVGNVFRARSIGTADFMEGPIASYSGTTLTITVRRSSGSSTNADWQIRSVDVVVPTPEDYARVAIECNRDIWVNGFPQMTDTAMASYFGRIKTALGAATTKVYSEFSNEFWNTAYYGNLWYLGAQYGAKFGTGFQNSIGGQLTAATSTTSLVNAATGSKVFTTQAGLTYSAGQVVRATSSGTGEWMQGTVASYSGTTLTLTITSSNGGTGTRADWNLSGPGNDAASIGKNAGHGSLRWWKAAETAFGRSFNVRCISGQAFWYGNQSSNAYNLVDSGAILGSGQKVGNLCDSVCLATYFDQEPDYLGSNNATGHTINTGRGCTNLSNMFDATGGSGVSSRDQVRYQSSVNGAINNGNAATYLLNGWLNGIDTAFEYMNLFKAQMVTDGFVDAFSKAKQTIAYEGVWVSDQFIEFNGNKALSGVSNGKFDICGLAVSFNVATGVVAPVTGTVSGFGALTDGGETLSNWFTDGDIVKIGFPGATGLSPSQTGVNYKIKGVAGSCKLFPTQSTYTGGTGQLTSGGTNDNVILINLTRLEAMWAFIVDQSQNQTAGQTALDYFDAKARAYGLLIQVQFAPLGGLQHALRNVSSLVAHYATNKHGYWNAESAAQAWLRVK